MWQVDRLLLELKLPPADAYFKLVHTLEEVRSSFAVSFHRLFFHGLLLLRELEGKRRVSEIPQEISRRNK